MLEHLIFFRAKHYCHNIKAHKLSKRTLLIYKTREIEKCFHNLKRISTLLHLLF